MSTADGMSFGFESGAGVFAARTCLTLEAAKSGRPIVVIVVHRLKGHLIVGAEYSLGVVSGVIRVLVTGIRMAADGP